MGSHQMAIALLGSAMCIASACAPAAIPGPVTASSQVAHRPERLTAGAAGLAAPMGPAQAGLVRDVPVREVVEVPVPAAVEAAEELDAASVAVPPPPAAGTVVVPERVELAEEHAVAPPVTRRAPRSMRRHRAPPSSSADAPVFTSPSVFTSTGP